MVAPPTTNVDDRSLAKCFCGPLALHILQRDQADLDATVGRRGPLLSKKHGNGHVRHQCICRQLYTLLSSLRMRSRAVGSSNAFLKCMVK